MLLQGPHAPAAGKEVGLLPSGPGNAWQLPEGFGLFTAEFSREGADLILEEAGGERLRLVDYFAGETPAEVHSHNGASLSGAVVARLAGPLFPGQYAQAGGGRDLADAIGQVETLDGTAYVQRTDGATEVLAIGTKVFQGDVVRTGDNGLLGITFADGTVFTLAAGSRMVLDELIYDPDGADNKGVFSLVEGSFVFIAGQAAATGGMEVNTPTATMGIRGTTVKVDIQTRDGISTVSVSLNPDFDGGTGAIQLFTLDGELIANITSTDSKWIISPPDSAIPPIEVERTESDIADDSFLLSQAVAALQSALNRVEQGQTFVDLPPSSTTDDAGPPGEGGDLAPPGGTDPGDIPSDGTDLDGQDEGLPEGEGSEEGTDDASLAPPSAPPPGPSGPSGIPQITVTSVQSTEDTPLTGNLGVTDANGDEVEVTLTQGAQNGQVVLLADGTFTYTPNENFEGTDSFTVTATDTTGASSESEVTVTVDAVNDAPVVTALQASGSTTETGAAGGPGAAPVTGNFTYADVDETEPATWSIVAAPETVAPIGTITINAATGVWDYLLDEGAADPLAEGEEVVETYIATVTDTEGASASEVVEVTIIGANDGPVIAEAPFSGALAEDITGFANLPEGVAAAVTEPAATGSLSGQFTFFDVDQRDQPGAWSWQADPGNETSFGAFEIDPQAGTWSYTLDQAAADVLGNDESVTETYIATVTDEFGASASQSVTVTITGFNDAPTILYSLEDITGTVFEEGFEPEAPGAPALAAFRVAAFDAAGADASGTLSYNDPDGQPDETVTWSVEPENASLGTMTIDQEGHWHYFLDEAAAQSLKEGEERIETFTATVTDALGQASSQVITITVIGANDESEIIALPQDLQGAVAEGGTQTATGTLTYLDPDAAEGEVATWSIGADGPSRGSMVIGPLDGAWVYDLDDALANDLGEGEVVQETFTATLTDALGATAAQTITISITGQNDAPLATGGDTSGMVKEAGDDGPGMPQASGTLTYSDPDLDGTLALWSAAASPLNSTSYGQFVLNPGSGAWTYDINQAAAEALQEGESATEVFTATVTDFFGASDSIDVTIEIKGSNDAPTLLDTSASLTEDTPEIAIDLAALGSDPDAGEDGSTLSYQLLSATPGGTAQIIGSALSFSTGTDFQELSQGEAATVELLVLATDQRGATDTGQVSLTIAGQNDAPTLTGASRTVAEGDAALSIDLAALADDLDSDASGATLTYQLVGPPLSGAARIEGTELIFDQAGEFDALAAGETENVTIVVDAVDQYGARATASYDVAVEGRNDPPVIQPGSDRTGTVTEPVTPNQGPPQSVSGTLSYVDVDAPSPLDGTWSTSPNSGAFGSFQIDQQTGVWTYILNETAAESLRAGETRTESFTATITDVDGGSDSTQVTITVRGTNDAPILSGTSGSLGEEEASIVFNLAPLASDVDAGDSASFSLLNSPAAGTAVLSGSSLTFFTNGDFDGLAEGESQLTSLSVQVQDSAGATDTATLAITVVGRNDGPEILGTSVIEGTVVEPGDPAGTTVTATGTLRYADADAASPVEGTWTISPLGAAFGTISIDPRTGVWTYRLDAEAADSLNEGETRTETFTATITDAEGATDSETVTITIRGTNDAPVLEDGSGSVGEDQASVGVPLAPLFSDVDSGDTFGNAIFTILSPPALGSALISGGSLTFRTDGDFEHLAEGKTSEVQIGLRVRDPQGGTDEATVTITVVGANDAPVILGSSVTSGTVVEPGPVSGPAITATGLMRYDDVDAASPTEGGWTISPLGTALGQMIIDSDSGRWTYTLNRAAADSLNEGETRTETFTATITDAAGATDTETVTITIRGTNDDPVLENDSGSVGEDQASVGINLAPLFSDVDSGDTAANATYRIITGPAAGQATLSGATLTFLTAGAFEALAEGETQQVQIIVEAEDTKGGTDRATITITVEGANDAPVILATSDLSGAVTEAGVAGPGVPAASGNLAAFDPDNGTELVWFGTDSGAFGDFFVDLEEGDWTYLLDNEAAEILTEGETRTETFEVTVFDSGFGEEEEGEESELPPGGSDTATVTITVMGSNDAPELDEGALAATEDGTLVTLDLTTLADDPDADDDAGSLNYALVGSGDLAEGGTAVVSGNTFSFDPGDDFQHLAAGEEQQITVPISATDQHSATTQNNVIITVTGQNDAPTIDDPFDEGGLEIEVDEGFEGGFEEENDFQIFLDELPGTTGSAQALTGQKVISFEDVDLNDIGHVATVQSVSTYGATAGLPDDPTLLTYLTANASKSAGDSDGTISWSFSAADQVFDYLSAFQSVTLSYGLELDDLDGGTAYATVDVMVFGANDAPTLVSGAADAVENGPAIDIVLSGLGDDIDSEDDGSTLFYTITGGPSEGSALINNSTMNFDPGSGFQDLTAGETRDVTISFTATDIQGAVSEERTITVTVTGVNSAPQTGDVAATANLADLLNGSHYQVGPDYRTWDEARAYALELGGYLANITSAEEQDFVEGFLTGQSVWVGGSDSDNEGVWKWMDGPEAGLTFWQFGDPVGDAYNNWNPTEPNDFGTGEDHMELRFPEFGWNDAPGGHFREFLIETPGTLIGTVAAASSDPDGDALSFSLTGTVSGLSMQDDGSFALDLTQSAFVSLSAGDPLVIEAGFRVEDLSGAYSDGTLRLTVIGVNDAPQVVAIDAGTVSEDDAPLVIDLLAGQSDPDTGTVLTTASISVLDDTSASVGFTDNGDGTITIDPAQFGALDSGQDRTITVNYMVTDGIANVANVATLIVEGRSDTPPVANDDYLSLGAAGQGNARIGYYDSQLQEGSGNQIETITNSGNLAVKIFDLTAVELDTLDVLTIQNPSNTDFGSEFLSQLSTIHHAVQNGLVLIVHDRFVTGAETLLPGSAGFDIRRDFSDGRNIELLNDAHPIATGPGGTVTDTSLDGGNWSSHGFSIEGSLPADADLILTTTTATEIVTFSYRFGAGDVVYSSIPLDFYLGGSGTAITDGMKSYATNLLDYAATTLREEPLTDENTSITIASAQLFSNDLAAGGGPLLVSDVSPYSTLGASVMLNTDGDIVYDPRLALDLDVMLDGEAKRDSFSYTITNDGGLTDTATVSFSVAGITDPPVYLGDTTLAFSFLADGLGYEIAQGFLIDQDEDGPVGLTVTSFGSEILPDWLSYSIGARTLSVDATKFNAAPEVGLNKFNIHGTENDGDASTLPLELFLEGDGSILFALVGRADDQAAPARLEIGLDGGGASGLVDLSGVASLNARVPGENILADVGYIDLRNGEDETLNIDADDLLALIEGNVQGDHEIIMVEADITDSVDFAEDGFTATESTPGSNVFEITALTGGILQAYEGVIATVFVDYAGGGPGG
jgi:VCBS repeat-containing protein